MAPEVIQMFGMKKQNRQGYTCAVDWWSLGCVIYHLLTGREPFQRIPYERLKMIYPGLLFRFGNNYKETHEAIFGAVNYESYSSILRDDAIDIMKQLLEFEPKFRLGCSRLARLHASGSGNVLSSSNWKKVSKKRSM